MIVTISYFNGFKGLSGVSIVTASTSEFKVAFKDCMSVIFNVTSNKIVITTVTLRAGDLPSLRASKGYLAEHPGQL